MSRKKYPRSNSIHSWWNQLSRRDLLKLGAPGVSSLLLAGSPWLSMMGCNRGLIPGADKGGKSTAALRGSGQPKKFLFVFSAMGGASINDSFLAVRASESKKATTLNVFPDALVRGIDMEGIDLRAVDIKMDEIGPLPFPVESVQSRFLSKYYRDIMVATVTGSTVSHPLGQKRFLTGNDAWNGRTLQEAVAAQYGADLLMPNVNMGTVGFAEHGRDKTLPSFAKAEPVPDPSFFPFGLHGYKGIQGAPDDELMHLARRVRNEKLEPNSAFFKTFGNSAKIQEWLKYRQMQPEIERLDLINALNPFEDTKDFPFKSYGLDPNPDGDLLRDAFPDLGADPLHTQSLLAYLLVTQGLSCAVTFGLGMNVTIDGSDLDNPLLTNTPTAFDYSHNAHRGTQALLWHKIFDTLDRLITLLKATEYLPGESYWDHSMIYIATEFGRDKTREENADEFPSGHHTNNGVAIISPMANGGKVLGGVDPDTLLTYGFDPETGEAQKNREMNEAEIYAGILHALGVDTEGSGLPSMRSMRKKA